MRILLLLTMYKNNFVSKNKTKQKKLQFQTIFLEVIKSSLGRDNPGTDTRLSEDRLPGAEYFAARAHSRARAEKTAMQPRTNPHWSISIVFGIMHNWGSRANVATASDCARKRNTRCPLNDLVRSDGRRIYYLSASGSEWRHPKPSFVLSPEITDG